jgi:hypothetical protein
LIDAEQVSQLRKTLKEKRLYGLLHFDLQAKEIFNKENIKATIDAYVTSTGLNALGEHWIAIDSHRADEIITQLFYRHQAYSIEIMPLDEAKALSKDILGLFTEPSQHYTNVDHDGSSMPVTGAPFDRGVVVLDETSIGMFWVEDED